MNPVSPFTYYRRHKGQALLLLVLIAALTLGVYTMVSLMDAIFENFRHSVHYLTRMSRLSTGESPGLVRQNQIPTGGTLAPTIAAQIRAHPDVAAVLPENGLYVGVPMGVAIPVPVLGATETDLPVVMEACDLQLKAGRLIKPRAGEIILSEELVRALDLQVGDRVSHKTNADTYPTIATELTLVGILESVPSDAGPKVWAGFVSYEYIEAHELYQPRATNWLILPRPGSRIAVNEFAASLIAESTGPSSVYLETFEGEIEFWEQTQQGTDAMYGFMDGLVAISAALVVGMIHRIAITRRLPELGLLHAAGYPQHRLIRRLVLEVAWLACVGWATGLTSAYAFLVLLGNTFFAARGWSTNLADPAPFLYTLPIPLVVVGWIIVSVNRMLSRLDPVDIIERGKLSMEEAGGRRQEARGKKRRKDHSSPRPLSSWTFYLRHRRRSILLLTAIGLMVLAVGLPGFAAAMLWDSALTSSLSYTSHIAVVSPGYAYRAIAPGIVAQIRAHPTVAHAIPVRPLSMVVNLPTGGSMWIPVYAAREQDLPTLLDVYGLRLGEGELVQPRSGHVVLTSALARNRNLGLGDAIGHPVHERDSMPTELTIVGLLEPTGPALVDRGGYDVPPMPRWVGFASYEYVDGHERYTGTPTHLLVVPVEGRESEMETWLQEAIASPQVKVVTLGTSYHFWQRAVQTAYTINVISMTTLTAVAALGLAILNTIFFTQRRDEFGILYAVGHSRAALVARTLRESVTVTAAAWLIGVGGCIASMLCAQAEVYAPLGLSIDFYNPTPWLFTLPIPVAVVAASAGTIAWALKRLDPVAVIERR